MPAMKLFSTPQLNPASDSGWRKRWFDIIHRHDTPASRRFDIALVLAILASVLVIMIDFQLAVVGKPRSRWLRLLAREDLRHLLKHKRTYCPQALTPVEKRLLRRRSWVRELWFATGKPVYRFITRKLLRWEDNEGRGPRQ